ncbi:MAG: S8 family serine peptidase [Pyrinomonadaceae bacterium]
MKSLPVLLLFTALIIGVSLYLGSINSGPTAAQSIELLSFKEREFARLAEKARDTGVVRVIVGLDVPTQPIGELARAERSEQKARIKGRQDDFLSRYAAQVDESTRTFKYIPFVAMGVNEAALSAMRFDPSIKSIEEDVADPPTLAESSAVIGAPTVWNFGIDGTGRTIAILDSGVDKNHTFLANKVVSEACYSQTVVGTSLSFCPGGAQSSIDPNSGLNCDALINGCPHGTHVAGIAAGTSANFSGIAKGANIIAIQVFSRFDNASSCGSNPVPCILSYVSNQVAGLERVAELSETFDIDVINMSLGGGQYFTNCDDVQSARKAAIDTNRSLGIATSISSGNSGYTNATSAPACISTAFSVGSSGDGSSGAILDAVVSSSNSAPFLSAIAPGRWIDSSVAAPGSNNNFSSYSGTSMAAPHVAGLMALLRSRNPEIPVTDAFNILQNTGLPISDTRNGLIKPRIQAAHAIGMAGPTCTVIPITIGYTSNGLSLVDTDCSFPNDLTRNYDLYSFQADAGQQISISMSASYDTFLELLDPTGQVIASDNNGGGGTNSRIPATSGFFTIPSAGTFLIRATYNPGSSAAAGSLGAYTLTLGGNCSYSFTPGSTSLSGAGGTGSFNIAATSSCPWTATSNAPWVTITSAANGSGIGTIEYSVAENTGAARSTTITGAGQTFTINQTGAQPTLFDYDGDGRSDLSVRRPANNIWYLQRGTAGYTAQEFGVTGDLMVPADYDGDGITDVAVFRPSNGTWYVYMSQSQTFQTFGWGQAGDAPVPTDRDNDGSADLVIYRESNNTWYTRFANATFNTFQFGVAGDKPMQGDFDGDGIGDVALFRPSNNNWYLLKSSLGFFVQTWGQAGDIPLTGDFDGDGATDQAVFRPGTGQWFLSRTTAGFTSQNWGQAGDIPVAADYDGDGKTDVAVFRPSNGTWYIVNSTTGILVLPFGQLGDVPTQASFIDYELP